MTRARKRGLAFDLAACIALMLFAAPVTLRSDEAGAGTWLDTVLLPLVILPLLARHRAPLAAAAALAAGCVISGIPTFDQFRFGAAVPAGMLILYSLARDRERRPALIGLGLVLAGMVFIGFTDVVGRSEGPLAVVLFTFPLCLLMWGGGRFVRARDQLAAQLAERSRSVERQRERTAELAVEVERTQVASDLDAAARDRVREMIEVAARGEQAVADEPDDARAAFAQIETMSRESLNAMRGLLGVLRSDERGERAPRPTLDQLEALLAEARRGGRPVELDVRGERRPLPGSLELAAYRVVQHALAVVRGADAEPATVEIRYLPGALELRVNGLAAHGGGAEAALLAARERVAAHGGSFTAAASDGGRRMLSARLPLVTADV